MHCTYLDSVSPPHLRITIWSKLIEWLYKNTRKLPPDTKNPAFSILVQSISKICSIWYCRVQEHWILNISCKHYILIRVELKYLIGSGYLRIFDGVCQAIEMIEAVGCQPIKILLRGMYHKSTNENASSRQSMCIYIRKVWIHAYSSMYRPFRPTAISGHTRLTSGHTRVISGHKMAETYHAISTLQQEPIAMMRSLFSNSVSDKANQSWDGC